MAKIKKSNLPKDHKRFKAFHDRFPLSTDQRDGLKADIVRTKQVRDPLVEWKGFLVDGYHRRDIIVEENIQMWSPVSLDAKWTEDQVYDWMVDNQINRRNMTEQQQELVIGEKYNREKAKTPGNPQLSQVDTIGKPPKGSTAARIAKEVGKSRATVNRYGKHEEIYESLPQNIRTGIDSQPLGKKLTDGQWHALEECDNKHQVGRNIHVHKMSLEDAYEEAMGKKMPRGKPKKTAKPKPAATDNGQPSAKIQLGGICKSIVKHRDALKQMCNGDYGLSAKDKAQITKADKALDTDVYMPLDAVGKGLK